MKLGTVHDGTRDGALVVVRRDGAAWADATDIARNLQAALDDWGRYEPALRARAEALEVGAVASRASAEARFRSPLPRAYEWIDGSAYINHVVLVRRARGAEPPETLATDPLIYQGGSGHLLDPTEDVPLRDPAWGLDFEGEVAVILGDVPLGTTAAEAERHVRLVVLVNDNTLRNLVPNELAKGFGFFQSKPASAFSPFALTPDELGEAWCGGRVHLPLRVELNGQVVGTAEAGPEMHFSFFDLVAHLARTRAYTAGTILGSGTVSNSDPERGISCLAERRMREIIETGKATTPFLQPGDEVRITMSDREGRDLFGEIRQRVVKV